MAQDCEVISGSSNMADFVVEVGVQTAGVAVAIVEAAGEGEAARDGSHTQLHHDNHRRHVFWLGGLHS